MLEGGERKVARKQLGEKPFELLMLLCLLETKEGAFLRNSAPWKAVPYASPNTDVVRNEDVIWKIQATFDESYLYVRFEAAQTLPAAGSKLRPEVAKTGGTG